MFSEHCPQDNPKDYIMVVFNAGEDIVHPETQETLFPAQCGMSIKEFQILCFDTGIDSGDFRFVFVRR